MTQPRKRTREEFESLVDETRVLVEGADVFWNGVRDGIEPKKPLCVEMSWEGWEALCEVWANCKDVLKDVHDQMSNDAEWAKRMEQVQKELEEAREKVRKLEDDVWKVTQTKRVLREELVQEGCRRKHDMRCLAKERSKRIAMELFLHDTYKNISDVIPSITKNPRDLPQGPQELPK